MILETTTQVVKGKKLRHLVLLYGAQVMRRFLGINCPNHLRSKIPIICSEEIKCCLCHKNAQILEPTVVCVNIFIKDEYICYQCLPRYAENTRSSLICISLSQQTLAKSSRNEINLEIVGKLLKCEESLKFLSNNNKCTNCQSTGINYGYRCVSSHSKNMRICEQCFLHLQDCIQSNHIILWEDYRFIKCLDNLAKKSLDYSATENYFDSQGKEFTQETVFYLTHNYEKAKNYFLKFLSVNERALNKDTAYANNRLGEIYYILGQHDKALEYHLKALNIYRIIYDILHKGKGNFAPTEKTIKEALKNYANQKAIYGEKHFITLKHLTHIGALYLALGEYDKALNYQLKAISIGISNLAKSENYKEIASLYSHLGLIYQSLGQHDKALNYQLKALEIQELIYDDKHPSKLTTYNNLALIYKVLGENNKALDYQLKFFDNCSLDDGENNKGIAKLYRNLGLVFRALGYHERALEYSLKSLQIRKTIYGNNHQYIAVSYEDLGLIYQELEKYGEAIDYFLRALEILKLIQGEMNPDTATSYKNIASIHKALGNHEKALEYSLKALEIMRTIYGDKHPKTAESYDNLGLIYQDLGKHEQALECCLKALEILKLIYGDKHPDTALSYNNLGLIYKVQGQHERALKYTLKALEIRKIIYGDKHPVTVLSSNNLGSIYEILGQHEQALEYFSQSLQHHEAS